MPTLIQRPNRLSEKALPGGAKCSRRGRSSERPGSLSSNFVPVSELIIHIPHQRKKISHSANANKAVKLGYTRIGTTTAMCKRNSTHRARKVSRIDAARQTIQAGKNEPRMSKEGAREQLASSKGTNTNQAFDLASRRFPIVRIYRSACDDLSRSRSGPFRSRLSRIPSSECQIGQSHKHLRACQHVRRLSL